MPDPRVRILLVDDHRIMRDGVRLLLEKEADFEVIGDAADATEALRQTAECAPDVIVMDIHLSTADGIDVSSPRGPG